VVTAILLLEKMQITRYESNQQARVSAAEELATSPIQRCLVALLSVGREDGS